MRGIARTAWPLLSLGLIVLSSLWLLARSAPAVRAAPPAAAVGVTLQGQTYSPKAVTVTVGSTVTWNNRDGAVHTVTATDGSWDSGRLDFGQSFSRSFDQPGTFPYGCQIHPGMTGQVVVTGAGPANLIAIQGYVFQPDTTTIQAGTIVTWTNHDTDLHSVVAADGSWGSANLRTNQTYSHRFSQVGTTPYICGLHPEMVGSVIVTTATGPTSTPTSSPPPTFSPTPVGTVRQAVYLPVVTRSQKAGW